MGRHRYLRGRRIRAGTGGVAYERFTRHGPAALLPLKDGRAGLVWCVDSRDDPVQELDDAQRVTVLNTIFHPRTPRLAALSPLKAFPLGLSAERTLTDGRIGSHRQRRADLAPGRRPGPQPRHARRVRAGALARASERDVDAVLRRLEWQRAPDRWAMIAATDFLARSFTWVLPGAATARGVGLAALQALGADQVGDRAPDDVRLALIVLVRDRNLPVTITDLDADALSRAIHAKEVSCREVMRATLDRIAAVNPR